MWASSSWPIVPCCMLAAAAGQLPNAPPCPTPMAADPETFSRSRMGYYTGITWVGRGAGAGQSSCACVLCMVAHDVCRAAGNRPVLTHPALGAPAAAHPQVRPLHRRPDDAGQGRLGAPRDRHPRGLLGAPPPRCWGRLPGGLARHRRPPSPPCTSRHLVHCPVPCRLRSHPPQINYVTWSPNSKTIAFTLRSAGGDEDPPRQVGRRACQERKGACGFRCGLPKPHSWPDPHLPSPCAPAAAGAVGGGHGHRPGTAPDGAPPEQHL